MRKAFCLLALLPMLAFGQENSLLWEISGNGLEKKSYLFGTIHLPEKDLFYVNDSVHEVRANADAGYFEIIIDPQEIATSSQRLLAKKGESVYDLLPQEDAKKIDEYFKAQSPLMGAMVRMLKPVGLTTTMVQMLCPADTSGAMDQLFQEDYKQAGKPIYQLETFEEQFELLFETPLDTQALELLEMVNEVDSVKNSLKDLKVAYGSQDLVKVDQFITNPDASKYRSMKALGEERNLKMFPKIIQAIQKESCFVAVGAAHLSGETGLVNLLKTKGFKLRAIAPEKQ